MLPSETGRRLRHLAPSPAGRGGDFIACVAGGASVLAFAPFEIRPLAVLCPAMLVALWFGVSPRRALLRGLLYGLGEFLAGIYWIYTSVSVVGGAPLWLGVLLYLALAGACAVFPGLVGYGACRLGRTSRWAGLVWIPASWTLFEWVRSFLLTGFPWLSLGFSQVGGPLGGYAPLGGVYGVSFLCVAAAVLLVAALAPRRRMLGRVSALAGILAIFGAGAALGRVEWTHPAGLAFRASLLQGNIPQTLKWEPGMLAPTLERYAAMTRAHWTSDLIVWPEGSVPTWFGEARHYLAPLAAEARRRHVVLVVGAPVYDVGRDTSYNAALALGAGRDVYYKRHLVPFGEYFPVPEWIKRWLSAHRLPYSSFSPGPIGQAPLELGRWRAAVALCYEIAFGRLLIRQLPAAEFIVNPSDDGWFGRSIALPQQFQMARFAALATGRYVLTATDDGITGIIGPHGAVHGTLPAYTRGALTGGVVPYAGSTPFVSLGNLPVVILGAVLILLTPLPAFRRRRMRERVGPPGP